MPRVSEEAARFLYRPIVFQEPQRAVHPPSWLEHVPFAFWIVDVLKPAVFVELGTQSGNSYAGFAQAIQSAGLPTSAFAVDTWKGDPQAGFYDESVFEEWARYHGRHFSSFSRLVRSTFEDAVDHFADGSVDLLHIDGFHIYEAASADFQRWRSKLSPRGIVLIHDINVRERDFGVWRLWQELKVQFPSFEFLHAHGLGVLALGTDLPEALQWLFANGGDGPDTGAIRQFFAQVGGAIGVRYAAAETERGLRAQLEQGSAAERSSRDERERLRTQLTAALKALDARTISLSQASARIANLDERLKAEDRQHYAALRQVRHVIADLQQELNQAAADRDRLNAQRGRVRDERRTLTAAAGAGRRPSRVRKLLRTAVALGLVPSRHWTPRLALKFLAGTTRFQEAHLVNATGLFNPGYYRSRYPDVEASRLTPLAHFVLRGAAEGRSPHPLFDGSYYLRHNRDVASSGLNPLVHYQVRGAREGRNPHPLFDVAFYLQSNPDVAHAGVEPLSHFLSVGDADGSDPNPFFSSTFYRQQNPDVVAQQINSLVHYVCHGWREGRHPSTSFDPVYYLEQNPDVPPGEQDPLSHYLENGRLEGRIPAADGVTASNVPTVADLLPQVTLTARSIVAAPAEPPTVLCLSHVMPWPPRAGNEYRIYRLLCWLRDQGYRIVPVIAPLQGVHVTPDDLQGLAREFSNAVLCERSGRLEYILHDVPDVLATLNEEVARPVSLLLDEDSPHQPHAPQLLQMDRAICHDALITATLRLQQVLGRHVLLAEYIWMSRILPLVRGDVVKVIDTHDVFSSKREKVLRFGIDDLHVEAADEARRLQHADLVLAIQDEERQALERLVPGTPVVTTGVDFEVVADGGAPSGRRLLFVASDNPMNRKGLSDFLRFAWPQIQREVPDAEFLLAGRISAYLEADVPGVTRLGIVADLQPLYRQARVVINPAVAGTGLKIKTLEALCHLRPVVTWPSGNSGLGAELAALCVEVQDWFAFARQVAGFLAAEPARLFSAAQCSTVRRLTSPATVYQGMTEAIAELRRRT